MRVSILCVHAVQVLAVHRDVDRRVLKLLVEWPNEEGFEMKSTGSGERLNTMIDVLLYVEGVTTLVGLRKTVASKSTETGTLAKMKRALAVRETVNFKVFVSISILNLETCCGCNSRDVDFCHRYASRRRTCRRGLRKVGRTATT